MEHSVKQRHKEEATSSCVDIDVGRVLVRLTSKDIYKPQAIIHWRRAGGLCAAISLRDGGKLLEDHISVRILPTEYGVEIVPDYMAKYPSFHPQLCLDTRWTAERDLQ